MANITISYVVVRYKIRKELFNLLDSIYAQKNSPSFEIIVVDNNTEDRIQKELHKKYPKVIYIENEVNNGLGGGVNLGNGKAQGEYIYVINPDMVLEKDSTHILYSFLQKRKNAGLVSPSYTLENGERPALQVGTKKLTPLRGAVALSAISSIFKNNKIYKDFYITDRNDSKDLEVDAVPGGAFLIKKSIYDSVEGFDKKFFLYFEEHDLSNRIKDLGFKNYIVAKAKVFHIGGIDSVNLRNTKTFQNSRFYYFKKHYGIFNALIVQFFANLNKTSVLTGTFLTALFGVSLFLRVFRLSELMSFIADQGFFYLSARDMLVNHTIPLVGPPTSHPWIHHGAHWTYLLASLLFISKFNPVFPAYFIALLGAVTVLIFYFIIKNMFSKKVAILSGVLYACSPLIVLNARLPYHTSPIPFFVILLFFSTYKWIKGNIFMFPLCVFLISVLYNHEITTFVYALAILLVFIIGLIYKKPWVRRLKNAKVIILSFIAFLIPMAPFLLYDTQNGYKQTFGFLVWVVYRVIKTPVCIIFPQYASSGSNPSTLPEFFFYYSQLIYAGSYYIAGLILLLTCVGLLIMVSKLLKMKSNAKTFLQFNLAYVLLLLFLGVGSVGLFIHRIPIEADTLLIAPFIIILTVLSYMVIFKKYFIFLLFLILIMAVANIHYLLVTEYATKNVLQLRIGYRERTEAISNIIKLSNGKAYTIKGAGDLSHFPAFTMPYEYLLWLQNYPITEKSKNIIYIEERNGNIYLTK